MQEFTKQDLENIKVLIENVPSIKGSEALTVALLLEKIKTEIGKFDTPVSESIKEEKNDSTKTKSK